MKKFVNPVSMECTAEQFERDLRKPLEEIWGDTKRLASFEYGSILVSNIFGLKGKISSVGIGNKTNHNRHYIEGYDPEQFLAMCNLEVKMEVGKCYTIEFNDGYELYGYLIERNKQSEGLYLRANFKGIGLEGAYRDGINSWCYSEPKKTVRLSTPEEQARVDKAIAKHEGKEMDTPVKVPPKYVTMDKFNGLIEVVEDILEIIKPSKHLKSLDVDFENVENKDVLPDMGFVKYISGAIVYRTGKESGFGVVKSGVFWKNSHWGFTIAPQGWQSATKEEFLEAMKPIFKDKGLVDGVYVECVYDVHYESYPIQKGVINKDLVIEENSNIYFYDKSLKPIYIFYKGKFAKPIEKYIPKHGEWIWVWKNDHAIPRYRQFKEMEKNKARCYLNGISMNYAKGTTCWLNYSKDEPKLSGWIGKE